MKTQILNLLFFFIAQLSLAQENTEIIDLSKNNSVIKTIPTNNFTIKVENMVSNENYHYEIDVNKTVKEIEPISVGFIKTKKHATHQISNINCLEKRYIELTSANLNKLISESELKDSISYIRYSMKKLDSSACSYNKKLYISKLKQHQKTILIKDLNKGEKISIFIRKYKKSIDGSILEKTWKREYKTPPRGEWRTTLGVGAAINLNRKTFRTIAQDSIFILEADGRRNFLEYTPSVQITYVKNNSNWLKIGPSIGLNLSTKDISVYGGLALIFYENVFFTTGAIFHRTYKLKNQIKENDTFSQNHDFNYLHDEFFTINPFISLTIRLGDFIKNNSKEIKN